MLVALSKFYNGYLEFTAGKKTVRQKKVHLAVKVFFLIPLDI